MVRLTPAQKRAWYAKRKLAVLQRHVHGLPPNVLERCTLRQLSFKVRAVGHAQQTLDTALLAYCHKGFADNHARTADICEKSTGTLPQPMPASCELTPQMQVACAFIGAESSWKLGSKNTPDCELACHPS